MESSQEYQRIIEFIIPENKIKEETVISPSGKYKLVIGNYRTKEGCWEYTCGEIYDVKDDRLICKIPRNYSRFSHGFFNKNNQEWLVTGITYMSQVFVNMDTCEVFDDVVKERESGRYQNGASFCWSNMWGSPDGNILAVQGCYWGGSYDVLFYDISDISKGWFEIKQKEYYEASSLKDPHWNEDNTFTIYCSSEYKKLNDKYYHFQDDEFDNMTELEEIEEEEYIDSEYTYQKQNDQMAVVKKWELEDKIRWTNKMNEGYRIQEEKTNEMWNNNKIYKKLKELTTNCNWREFKTFSSPNMCSTLYMNDSKFLVSYYNYEFFDKINEDTIRKDVNITWNDKSDITVSLKKFVYKTKDTETKEHKFPNDINSVNDVFELIKNFFL